MKTFADIDELLVRYLPKEANRPEHDLGRIYTVLEFLGNPHQLLRVIHVAGTSGKTSTAYYIAALLRASGKRVGLTVSPHVDGVNERVQIDLMPLPEGMFVERFGEYMRLVKQSGVQLNYFELFMLFALWEFAAQKVDYAVVEVGIGGLKDSTNIFDDPQKVCVITDIGYDHRKALGGTLTDIATHKAGIIHQGNAVFCYSQGREVRDVIRQRSEQQQARLYMLEQRDERRDFDFLPLFQQRNFGLAEAVVKYVAKRDRLPVPGAQATRRAAEVPIPARMEIYELEDKTLILDVAHNEQKVRALLKSVRAEFGNSPLAILARMHDGRVRNGYKAGGLGELAAAARHLIVTSEPGETVDEALVSEVCRQAHAKPAMVVNDAQEAFAALRRCPESVLVVTGSFLLLNHIRPLLA